MQLRALLIQLSDQLSDTDRNALHFYIGPYVSRKDRDDCTPTGTLHLFEILFDRSIVSDDNVDYLIRGFETIRCTDASEKLKMYKQYLLRLSVFDATPPGSSPLENYCIIFEEDKLPTMDVFTPSAPQESPSSSAEPRDTYDDIDHPLGQFQTIASPVGTVLLKKNSLVKRPARIQRRIYYPLVAAFVIFSVLSCAYIFRSKIPWNGPTSVDQSSAVSKQKAVYILREGVQHGNHTLVQSEMFDDAKDLRLSYMDRCIGVQLGLWNGQLNIIRFLYSNKGPDTRFGLDPDVSVNFMLNPDEDIRKINLYESIDQKESKIVGVRFFTTAGRRSDLFGSDDGRLRTESFEYYSFGYARGRQERQKGIDMLQFIWIKQASLKDSMGTVSRSLVESCEFTFTSKIDLRVVRARGTEASWDDLKEQFDRKGPHCGPSALYYRTESARGPQLFAIIGNDSVYYHEDSLWEKYLSARDIQCSLVAQLNSKQSFRLMQ